ncbi:MAG: hypothetical protein K9N49_08210, partial [Candidatus Marinimicrobia bacterium]|nr:hypothetical protein [Candidatus Neomarinimicrobiota bacterium]
AVITTWGSPRLNAAVLARNRNLRIMAHAAGSVAPHVSPELFARGVRVTSANPLMARTVAEAGFMLMQMGLRQVHRNSQLGLRSARMDWDAGRMADIRVPEDLTIGIWGYGDIARWVVHYLKPYSPRQILVASRHLSAADAARDGLTPADFDQVFAQADVIFVLAGMTAANRDRVGPEQLDRIRAGACLINLGRAELIQRAPLLAALKTGRFTGIFDVFHDEPLPPADPLQDLPNVILTPHNAGTGRYGQYLPAMAEEIDRALKGQPLRYEIQPDRVAHMTR